MSYVYSYLRLQTKYINLTPKAAKIIPNRTNAAEIVFWVTNPKLMQGTAKRMHPKPIRMERVFIG